MKPLPFLRRATLWLAFLSLAVTATAASAVRHTPLLVEAAPATPLPTGKRIPVGWPAFAVGTVPVTLRLPADAANPAPTGPAASPRHTQFRSR